MTRDSVVELIKDRIADEDRLSHDFHRGRVSAFRFALELIEDIDGDRLVDGKKHYGDRLYERAAAVLGYQENSLKQFKRISDLFSDQKCRRLHLSWAHHYEVASLKTIAEKAPGMDAPMKTTYNRENGMRVFIFKRYRIEGDAWPIILAYLNGQPIKRDRETHRN